MSYFNFEVIPASDCLSYKQHYQLVELGGLGDRRGSSSFHFL
jgi:hypothetical protein